MPELTIELRTNPVTGRKDIVVHLREDGELLPHEHEEQHRRLVEQLIGRGVVDADELGEVVVQRVEPNTSDATTHETESTAPERKSQSGEA